MEKSRHSRKRRILSNAKRVIRRATFDGLEPRINFGGGTFAAGEFNFCVSVRFNATATELAQIKTAFQNASQILADATDGQHRFGEVSIANDSGASNSAEYWVNAGSGRAYATAGKYGIRGEHVNLFMESNFKAAQGAGGDAYTIAHEHSHHAYGILDEYSGPAGNAENAPASLESPTLNYSLMDNYFTRGGRATNPQGGYTLNEFSVPSNHDPDSDTYQTTVNHRSDWEQVALSRFAATAPTGLPVSAAPAAHTVTFEDAGTGLSGMIVIDHSGSMAIDDRLGYAKSGAGIFTRFVGDGDKLGLASFDDSASVNFPLSTMTPANRTALRSSIDSIQLGGSTNIGGGLLAGLSELTGMTEHSCDSIIVLLSDGDHNTGTPPLSVIPQLNAEHVTVLSIGLGNGISADGQSTLQAIASQTGGRYSQVGSSFDLVGLFLRLSMESVGTGILADAPLSLLSRASKTTTARVEQGAGTATFALAIADEADQINFSLRSPSGVVINSTSPGVEFVTAENLRAFRVPSPEAGLWTMVADSQAVTDGRARALAFAENEGVNLVASLRDDTLTYPEQAIVEATPHYKGLSVTGATVTGNVVRPDGSTVAITLFDDGKASSGDSVANDGVYASKFQNYSGNGTYTFNLKVDNVSGKTFGGETLFSGGSNAASVPQLVRYASATAVVTAVPAGPSVTSYTLINADTDQPIMPLVEGTVLHAATLPTTHLNVRADVGGGVLGSVLLKLDNGPTRIENTAPYALFGNNGNDYLSGKIGVGSHTLVGTPYTAINGGGTAGSPLTVNFSVVDRAIVSYMLVNADTDQDIAPLTENMTLNLAAFPRNLNIRVVGNGEPIGSVKIALDGGFTRIENTEAFALFGNDGADYFAGTFHTGNRTITATPYANDNAKGAAGVPLSLKFKVINVIGKVVQSEPPKTAFKAWTNLGEAPKALLDKHEADGLYALIGDDRLAILGS